MKKIIASLSLAAGALLYANNIGGVYSGLVIVPQDDFKVAGTDLKTKPMLGIKLGAKKNVYDNWFLGLDVIGALGKLKDYDDWAGYSSVQMTAGYSTPTEIPVNIYGIVGYEWVRISDWHTHGAGYGAGISTKLSWFAPSIEYTVYNLTDSTKDYRLTIGLDSYF